MDLQDAGEAYKLTVSCFHREIQIQRKKGTTEISDNDSDEDDRVNIIRCFDVSILLGSEDRKKLGKTSLVRW